MPNIKPQNLFIQTTKKLINNNLNLISIVIVFIYVAIATLSYFNLIAANWYDEVGDSYESPSIKHLFGTDIFGQSVLSKIIKGTEIAMSVGIIVSIVSVFIGVTLGICAGYFGGIIDYIIVWIYTTVSSVPQIMLLISLTYIFGKGIFAVYIALGMTFWVELCQMIRSEVKRHKEREYIYAASAMGASHLRKIFRHIVPNIAHIIIIRFSLIFQQAIKSEVLLSYLGLGVQDKPSWGRIINESKLELTRGVWWQLLFATTFMFVIVLSFNLLCDSLRDAFDPKLKNK